MPSFNFFKIYAAQKANLSNLLLARGMILTDTKVETDNSGIKYTYELYFNQNPPIHPVKWIKELEKKFAIPNCHTRAYSAVVMISYGTTVYAVAFGSAHFLIAKFADSEFGINIASRVIERYKAKNSREFGGIKTKSIETYASADDLTFDAGEAVYYIKGSPSKQNEKKWGKTISCGQSVQLQNRTFTIQDLHKLCVQLDNAYSLPLRRDIPRSIPVTDDVEIEDLNAKLEEDMKTGHYMVNISQQQLSGVAFLFADRNEFVCVVDAQEIVLDEELSLDTLKDIVSRNFGGDYRRLLKSKVEAREDGACIYSKPFQYFVDYIDTRRNCYLEEGEWYRFDSQYLTTIHSEADRIHLEHSTEIDRFDKAAFIQWQSGQRSGDLDYRELYLNELLARDYGYENQDRKMLNFENSKVELADLYKNETVFVVKMGKPQVLNYAIDQATATIRVLERQKFEVTLNNGSKRNVKKICLWLFFERITRIVRISEVKSLIFLMKLAKWRKAVLLSGLQPEIRVSYT